MSIDGHKKLRIQIESLAVFREWIWCWCLYIVLGVLIKWILTHNIRQFHSVIQVTFLVLLSHFLFKITYALKAMIFLCFPSTRRVYISGLKLGFSTPFVCKQSVGFVLKNTWELLNVEEVVSHIINSNTLGN